MEAASGRAIAAEDIPKYEGLLKEAKEKVDELRAWKDKAEGATPQFEGELREALGMFSAIFNIFRDDAQLNRYRGELSASSPNKGFHTGISPPPPPPPPKKKNKK